MPQHRPRPHHRDGSVTWTRAQWLLERIVLPLALAILAYIVHR